MLAFEGISWITMTQLALRFDDVSSYASLIRWCGSAKALLDGKRLHQHILKCGLGRHMLLGNLLLQMYGNCGALESARALFAELHEQNQFSWNFIIAAHARHGHSKEALQLFAQVNVIPNRFIFASVLPACVTREALPEGKRIHTRILSNGFESDVSVVTGLINMYSKCDGLAKACRIFASIPEHNTFSWTAMVTAYAQHGQSRDALQMFLRMQQEGAMPSKVTFVSTLSACTSEPFLVVGKRLHACLIHNGYNSEPIVETALVNMYAKCGNLEEARWLFDNMHQRDELSWNAMITGYAQHGHCKDAFRVFHQMLLEGVILNKFIFASILCACASQAALAQGKQVHACIISCAFETDLAMQNALVNMYGKCGSLKEAQTMFDNMAVRDKYLWTAMIVAYSQHGKCKDALQIFEKMQQERVIPDKVTFASILAACAVHASLAEGKQMHDCIAHSGLESDLVVGNALVNMYSKCGSLKDARKVFDKMAERDTVSWNGMIAAYAQHGKSHIALQLFGQMQRAAVSPDESTYISVLSCCSHSGMFDEGCRYFARMRQDYGINPSVNHYNCMIDLLGRAGRLDEAEGLIMNMPWSPTNVSWMTLLGACRSHIDVERGEHYAQQLFELDSDSTAPYVMLANMYVLVGMEDEAVKVLNAMNEKKGLRQLPRCTAIELNCGVQGFFVDNQLGPQKGEFNAELQNLTRQMEEINLDQR